MSFKSNQFDSQLKKSTINKDRNNSNISSNQKEKKDNKNEVLSNQVKYDSLTKKSSAVLDMEFKVNELEARLRELSRRESLNTNKQDTTILELELNKRLNEKEIIISNLMKENHQLLEENKKLKNSKERRNSTMNKKAIHNEFEFYANDDIQNQIEQLVIMESASNNLFNDQIVDPVQEYEDFILNEICPNPDNMTYEQMMDLGEKVGNVENGLNKKEIEKLKKVKFSKRLKSYNTKLPDKCAICQFEYEENEYLRQLKCGHCFHSECVDGWLTKNRNCPLCKFDNK